MVDELHSFLLAPPCTATCSVVMVLLPFHCERFRIGDSQQNDSGLAIPSKILPLPYCQRYEVLVKRLLQLYLRRRDTKPILVTYLSQVSLARASGRYCKETLYEDRKLVRGLYDEERNPELEG